MGRFPLGGRMFVAMALALGGHGRVVGAIGIIGVEGGGADFAGTHDDAEDGGQDQQGGAGGDDQTADDGAAQRSASPPSPRPSAIGIMPAIMAQLVMRMGRRRSSAPVRAPSAAPMPVCRAFSAKVTSENGVGHRHADRHDRAHERLDVERRVGNKEGEGHAGNHGRGCRHRDESQLERLKIGGEHQEHDHHRVQPGRCQAARTSAASRAPGRGHQSFTPRGGSPGRA